MNRLSPIIIVLFFTVNCFASESSNEQKIVKDIITKAVMATHKDFNLDEAKKYYHEGFVLLTTNNNQLWSYNIYNWLEDIKCKVPEKKDITLNFEYVDIDGSAASVKFLYIVDGALSCTDYVLLYKFEEGWRIVSQTTSHLEQ